MMTLMAVFWTIWIERHCHTFQGIQNHDNWVVDIIFSKVALWASRCKEFQGNDVDSIVWSWNTVLKGVGFKPFQCFTWCLPPMGVLKLNFDVSFIKGGV